MKDECCRFEVNKYIELLRKKIREDVKKKKEVGG